MKNKSKSKGNSFEREISKKLSLWLTESDDTLWRTQNSGGRFTSRHKKNKDTKNQGGDITSTHPDSKFFTDKFSIECKHYKEINLWSFLTGVPKNNIIDFWKQTVDNAKLEYKQPLLIAKANNKPTLFLVNETVSQRISSSYNILHKMEIIHPDIKDLDNLDVFKDKIYIYLLDDILKLDSIIFKHICDNL